MINMDFSQRVVIDTHAQDWVASPKAGVWRKPLAREEAERGHATSIVRYDPGASFSPHNHPGGEEILVLEGTFSDESGDYHAGTYFRNPIGYTHAPFSEAGCMILVKLHQFQNEAEPRVAIKTDEADWQDHGDVHCLPLYEFRSEHVALLKLRGGAMLEAHEHPGGEEVYVIEGELSDEHGRYPIGTWLRSPPGMRYTWSANVDTLIWIKTGHLAT